MNCLEKDITDYNEGNTLKENVLQMLKNSNAKGYEIESALEFEMRASKRKAYYKLYQIQSKTIEVEALKGQRNDLHPLLDLTTCKKVYNEMLSKFITPTLKTASEYYYKHYLSKNVDIHDEGYQATNTPPQDEQLEIF